MKFINFDNYIKKKIMNILIKTFLYPNILVIMLFWVVRGHQKPT